MTDHKTQWHWRLIQHLTYYDHTNTNWQWFIQNKHVKDDPLQHKQRDIYTPQFRQSSSEVQFRVVESNRGSRWPCSDATLPVLYSKSL